jgi:hypothetical protein
LTKYLKLFEDFSKEDTKESYSPSWSDIRDTMQNRLPFAIIIFMNKDSYLDAKSKLFNNHTYVYQKAFLSKDGKLIAYPSVFIKLDEEQPFLESIPEIYEKYKIKAMIVGGQGDEYSKYYFKDGTSAPVGNEIMTSLEKFDMNNEDHFQFGSNLYRFIDFAG